MKRSLMLPLLCASLASSRAQMENFRGASDASTAVAAGQDHVFVANDENEKIYLYKRDGGKPLSVFDFSKELRAPKQMDKEVDIEASTRIGKRIYWLGSHSNKKGDGKFLPNRHRLFATDVFNETNLTFVGRYDSLRAELIEWDKRNFRIALEQSASIGTSPEEADGKGFNIEGLTVAPDGKTFLIGFRAPLIVTNGRAHAVLIPLLNISHLIGSPSAKAQFGPPVLLDLGGRGIRSIETFTNIVLIVAGPAASDGGDFKLFVWDGSPTSQPTRCEINLERTLRPEAIVGWVNSIEFGAPRVQLLSDDGKNDLGFVGFRSFNVTVCPVREKKQ